MGVSVLGRNSDGDRNCGCNYCEPEEKVKTLPNPDPKNWVVNSARHIGEYLVVEMYYPDCTNYEGKKMMVFKCSLEDLKEQAVVDPHFGEGRMHYPIARFEPTAEGWRDACNFATMKHLNLTHDSILLPKPQTPYSV